MNSRDVVIALVPGSAATTMMYDKVIPILTAAGYSVRRIELPSANDGTLLPAPQMSDDAAHIHAELLALLDAGHDVVLCVQSYSGMPGSQACQDLSRSARGSDRSSVIGIVYAASYIPFSSESVRTIMDAYIPDEFKAGVPGEYFPNSPPEACFSVFNDLDREKDRGEILRYADSMTAHSSDTFSGIVDYEAWRDIPGTTVVPGDDLIIATVEQERMYRRARKEGAQLKRVFVEGGGHGITVSQPKIVADEIMALARGEQASTR